MEVLLLLLILIILFVLLIIKGDTNSRLQSLEAEIKRLQRSLSEAQFHIEQEDKAVQASKSKPLPNPKMEDTYWETGFKVVDQTPELELQEPILTDILQQNERTIINEPEPITEQLHSTFNAAPTKEHRVNKPTFFERNPDLEKFIGENLISKIGIGILVLAIAYFVKFAIDKDWIGEIGRVAIGLICGGILVGLAHRMRNNYKAFSSVLVGGGIAVFYFTIALAYHQFHLFSQTTAFIIMVVITAFAVALSLWYNRQEVAIIALVGGFAAPFMVSDGSGNYKTLFIYLILLNTGLLVIAYNKAWRLVNLLAFIFTVILTAGWLLSLNANEPYTTYKNAFIFFTIFYLLFFAINLAHNIKENRKFIASDFGILLANTALYFSAGLLCLFYLKSADYKGLFSASMGVFNLVASYILFRNKKVDVNILYLLIGITLTFVSLTAPLQLNGNNITLFWASEAVLLYWLSQKSGLNIVKTSALIVWTCMIVSLLIDLFQVYGNSLKSLTIIGNKGFITTIYAALTTFAIYHLKQKEKPEADSFKGLFGATFFFGAAIVLIFIAGFLEIHQQFLFHYPHTSLYKLYLQLYTFVFVIFLLYIIAKRALVKLSQLLQLCLLFGCIIIYLGMIETYFSVQLTVLKTSLNNAHFAITHWLTAGLTAIILYNIISIFRSSNSISTTGYNNITWLLCAVIIVFVSVELNLLVRSLFYSKANTIEEIQRVYIKAVLPIFWGLCSFVFMWIGMKNKYRTLRIVSLSLFSLTLIKLFVFDIRNIPIAGKIAAFFCLGVLLLVVSFMYQRLKEIIIEDEQKPVI